MANTTGKKFGGRKAGTPNKISPKKQLLWELVLFELKDEITSFLRDEMKKNPKSAMKLMLSISAILKTKNNFSLQVESELLEQCNYLLTKKISECNH